MEKTTFIGLGVAGNFAGHLEQAGEAKDFEQVETQERHQPKAIFPFYVPAAAEDLGDYAFLTVNPLSADRIVLPREGADNLQIEPEIALLCEVQYSGEKVTALLPRAFAAYNDCSIRRPNANKICKKKNWGAATKGLAAKTIPLTRFDLGSEIDDYRIACFHKRNDVLNAYGVDSPALGYSYFHQKLLDWIVGQMNHQPDFGPMNNIAELLQKAHYPTQAIISIGATRYTEFGTSHFLQPDDVSIVAVYNGKKYTPQQIEQMAATEQFAKDISALVQKVV
ncbi:DUF5718 family protein [Avibacterium paragallinarum]|uniref:DUF5718 family protein n=3 Tax=Avibacterium paragallinarum TaxID=728 RepID=A0AAE5WGT0_AVIPA|nr:DUF5718 family protein [Avibacterium paragallinarum]MEE3608309.1 DUF5718 family protein [Avibacterium paragallinarum]MEE3621359.1 DUF5718 family protein [Avibacterium paragallinarum]MEE3668069.1 DUF5718 family protein [Avibacterium paragallinarum]MEE3681152.1 DUF5718 family protein [Avibacterium paragallinarum]MEE4386346.1 DUF5718 family protein [Avibacterium paragallinarum]